MMRASCKWESGLKFNGAAGGRETPIDGKPPLGRGEGMTPKELLAVSLCGCTGMDVAAHLRKQKQAVESLEVFADVDATRDRRPNVFTKAILTFEARGAIDPEVLLESVRISQSLDCGVSAMLVKAFPICYVVKLNGQLVGEGRSSFED